jgi:hypothetical protein
MAERKIYKTMQGKTIDFDQLRLSNELVPAVGNMKVNARGDELGPKGNIIKSRDEIVDERIKEETSTMESYTEDFGPEPELSPEQAQEILANRKQRPQGK